MPDVRMPDGTIIRNVPANATKAQIQAAYERARQAGAVEDKRPTSFGKGALSGAARAVSNQGQLLGAPAAGMTSPLGSILGPVINAGSQLLRGATNQYERQGKTRGSTAGRIAGEVVATLPTGGYRSPALGGAVGAALTSNNIRDPREVLTNAAVGAVGGKLGEQVGKRVVAPVAERIGRTAPARAVASAVASTANRLGKNVPRLPNPKLTKADKAVRKMDPVIADIRKNVADAADMNLPYSLADADPRLRILAGSVARRSPEARTLAEQAFEPRARGQADRAVNAIDQYLAPRTDIEARSAEIRNMARVWSDPYYKKAFNSPAPDDEALSAILRRPSGQEALAAAKRIAQDEGKSPSAFDYYLNEAGSSPIVNEAGRYAKYRLGNPRDMMEAGVARAWNGGEVPTRGPVDLVGWLRQQGGITDQSGELRHMGLNNAARRGMDLVGQEARFGPLVNPNGMNFDDAALRAWEAGYFPGHSDRPSINEFLDAVRSTHEGWKRHFTADDLPKIDDYRKAIDQRDAARVARFENGSVPQVDTSVDAGPREFPPLSAYDMQAVERPTMETLDLVKRGFDQTLNQYRNPLDNKLVLEGNPQAQSVNSLLQQFKARLDEISPEYAQARKVYQEEIADRTALRQGYDLLPKTSIPQRQFDAAVGGLNERTLPEAQRGFATAMMDQIDKVRLSGNPYEAVYGSPLQQGKVARLFPEGVPRFDRQYQLEKDMAKTAYETLGGSPTAARLAADQAMVSNIGQAVGTGLDIATGGKTAIPRLLAQKVGDRVRAGSVQNATEVAPVMFNTDTQAVLQYLDDLMRKDAEAAIRRQAYARASGLLGAPVGIGAASTGR